MRWSLNPYDGPWPLASSPKMSDAMAKAVGARMHKYRRRARPPARSAAHRLAKLHPLSREYRRGVETRRRIPKRHRLSWAVNCEREFDRGGYR